jgi:hypothetical protein
LTWDDLLVPDEDVAAAPEPDDDDDSEEDDGGGDAETPHVAEEPVPSGESGDDIKLIERLLGRKGVSSALREELEGYKGDIEAGEFTTADRQYLEALRKRLSSASKSRSKD